MINRELSRYSKELAKPQIIAANKVDITSPPAPGPVQAEDETQGRKSSPCPAPPASQALLDAVAGL